MGELIEIARDYLTKRNLLLVCKNPSAEESERYVWHKTKSQLQHWGYGCDEELEVRKTNSEGWTSIKQRIRQLQLSFQAVDDLLPSDLVMQHPRIPVWKLGDDKIIDWSPLLNYNNFSKCDDNSFSKCDSNNFFNWSSIVLPFSPQYETRRFLANLPDINSDNFADTSSNNFSNMRADNLSNMCFDDISNFSNLWDDKTLMRIAHCLLSITQAKGEGLLYIFRVSKKYTEQFCQAMAELVSQCAILPRPEIEQYFRFEHLAKLNILDFNAWLMPIFTQHYSDLVYFSKSNPVMSYNRKYQTPIDINTWSRPVWLTLPQESEEKSFKQCIRHIQKTERSYFILDVPDLTPSLEKISATSLLIIVTECLMRFARFSRYTNVASSFSNIHDVMRSSTNYLLTCLLSLSIPRVLCQIIEHYLGWSKFLEPDNPLLLSSISLK